MASSCPRSVLPAIARADGGESSMRLAETSRKRFSASRKIDAISPTERDSLFGLRAVKKWIGSPGSCAGTAGDAWKARRSVAPTAGGIMLAFLKIQTETNSRFVVGRVRLFQVRRPAAAWPCLPRDQTPLEPPWH